MTGGASEETRERSQREAVRERYGALADGDDGAGCCDGTSAGSSCGSGGDPASRGRTLGYSPEDLASAPEDANLGLGCGNPKTIAELEPGETVLDLGSGGGFDCFLAAEAVGESGQVIGVDMTPEMVKRARENAAESAHDHVEFRLGEIEHLPVADEQVDVVISNCVVNLSPQKGRVFEEAHRVLTPGGRVAISDVVAAPGAREAPRDADPAAAAGCVAGAATPDELHAAMADAGFEAVSVHPKDDSEAIIREMYGDGDPGDGLASAVVGGVKPSG